MKKKSLIILLVLFFGCKAIIDVNKKNAILEETLKETTNYTYINMISKNSVDNKMFVACDVEKINSYCSGEDFIYLLKAKSGTVLSCIENIKKTITPFIVEPDYINKTFEQKFSNFNDSFIKGEQYYSFFSTKLKDALEIYGVGNDVITVAVVDTGINPLHEEFLGVDISGWCAYNRSGNDYESYVKPAGNYQSIETDKNWDGNPGEGHGSYVAGVIAAKGNNGKGVVGVMPANIKLKIFKVFAFRPIGMAVDGSGSNSAIYEILQKYIIGDDIGSPAWKSWDGGLGQKCLPINMSYGKYSVTLFESYVINKLIQAGAIIISASGNDGKTTYNFPAAYTNVVSVGSVDGNDRYSNFSTGLPNLSLVAPGSKIVSVFGKTDNQYLLIDGTSGASPFITGVAALALSHNPNLTNIQLRELLEISCDDVETAGFDFKTGNGRINVLKAVENAKDSGKVWEKYTTKIIKVKITGGGNSGVVVNLHRGDKTFIAQNMSYDDGTTFFSGLKTGTYNLSIEISGRVSNIFKEVVLTNSQDEEVEFIL